MLFSSKVTFLNFSISSFSLISTSVTKLKHPFSKLILKLKVYVILKFLLVVLAPLSSTMSYHFLPSLGRLCTFGKSTTSFLQCEQIYLKNSKISG